MNIAAEYVLNDNEKDTIVQLIWETGAINWDWTNWGDGKIQTELAAFTASGKRVVVFTDIRPDVFQLHLNAVYRYERLLKRGLRRLIEQAGERF